MRSDFPTLANIPDLRELWKASFGDDDAFLDSFFSTAFDPSRCRCILDGDRAVAAVYWMDCRYEGRKLAYIYALAVHPDHRGQGISKYLMADARTIATAQGYEGALLVPGDDKLRQMYRFMGFSDCTSIREYVCGSVSGAVDIHPVTRDEYETLRRNSLPQGGVLQEGSSLDFLAAQAQFYAGSGFLLCARREGDDLRGLEYLGSPDLAPKILCTLGCAHGTFRIPGDQIPFAMFAPITPDCPVPSYFGLAFD